MNIHAGEVPVSQSQSRGGGGGFILVHFALEGMCNNYPTDLFTSSISTFNQAQRTHLLHGCSLHLPWLMAGR